MLKDNRLSTNAILDRLNYEAVSADGDGKWWACLRLEGGQIITRMSKGNETPVTTEQHAFASTMVSGLNYEIHHGGQWIVMFTNPGEVRYNDRGEIGARVYNRWCFLWMDADGDIQFTIENDTDRVEAYMAVPVDGWLKDAEDAWLHWHRSMRQVLDPKQNQLIKVAENSGRAEL